MLKIVIFGLCIHYMQADITPVFLWGYYNISANLEKGLTTINANHFVAEIVSPLLQDHMLVLFLEENLLMSDFNCRSTDNNVHCFEKLQRIERKMFLQQVTNPLEILENNSFKHQMLLNGDLDTDIDCDIPSLHMISFSESVHVQRSSQLSQHDTYMFNLSKRLKDCAVVYIYMSNKKVENKRDKRENLAFAARVTNTSNATIENPVYLHFNDFFAIAFSKLTLETTYVAGNVDSEELEVLSVSTSDYDAARNFDVTMNVRNDETLTFKMTHVGSNAYCIHEMSYRGIAYNPSKLEVDIEVPEHFSFYCGNLKLTCEAYYDDIVSESLLWSNLQFQHMIKVRKHDNTSSDWNDEDNDDYLDSNETFTFYDAWNCDSILTAGSLMGLVISLLLATVLGAGLVRLLNIESPPRFEDPRLPAFEGAN